MRKTDNLKGFTLIELLVVIAIIALLLAILVPTLRKVKDQAMLMICASNQRQIVNAVTVFQADHKGNLPPAISGNQVGQWDINNPVTDSAKVTHWHRPTAMSYQNGASNALNGGHHGRFMLPYLDSVNIYNCPMAPIAPESLIPGKTYTYQESYQEILESQDGTYTLLWNYQGFDWDVTPGLTRFVGPGSKKLNAANLLICDGFFYSANYIWGYPGQWTLAMAHPFYGSSRETIDFPGKRIYHLLYSTTQPNPLPSVKLNAGYVDGHVERYDSREDTVNCKNAVVQMFLPKKFK
jgi:prepilin-type N-terminal cleavage/methylation domain-containing protein/prepilin-type processing-associated H-X9-DG protein